MDRQQERVNHTKRTEELISGNDGAAACTTSLTAAGTDSVTAGAIAAGSTGASAAILDKDSVAEGMEGRAGTGGTYSLPGT